MKNLFDSGIDIEDIVQYEEKEHKVTKVWNHGYPQWWFDLECLTPMIPGLPYIEKPMSCPHHEIKLLRKAGAKK